MTGIIILAAGRGGRFGQPKQNLVFQNQTLLQRAIATAKASACCPIIVVIGAHTDLIDGGIESPEVKMVFNAKWEEGMASSIRTGIEIMKDYEDVESALIMLCDQPLLTPSLINDMLQKQQTSAKAIVGCSYNDTIGVPVLFHRSVFDELLLLQGREGAKKVLGNHTNDVASVPFAGGSLDIDTPQDYERLIKSYQSTLQ
jgi:molybdenum cofactor cytidylyltransferase